MIAAALLIAVYLCLPTFNPLRSRLPELVAESDARTRGGLRRQVTNRVSQIAVQVRERVRTVIGGERISPAVLLDAAAALDIIGACLSSGMPLSQAMAAAADGANPELAEPLRQCSARLSVGAHSTWESLAATPALVPLATAGRRAAESGTVLAQALEDTAATYRSQAHDAAQAVAEKAGVLIAGPLALCFLPAFVVLGLVPTIAGLADEMFAGLMPS